jgi:hypothetical protein
MYIESLKLDLQKNFKEFNILVQNSNVGSDMCK